MQARHAGKLLPLTRFGKDDAEIPQGAIVSNKLLAEPQVLAEARSGLSSRVIVMSQPNSTTGTAMVGLSGAPSHPARANCPALAESDARTRRPPETERHAVPGVAQTRI